MLASSSSRSPSASPSPPHPLHHNDLQQVAHADDDVPLDDDGDMSDDEASESGDEYRGGPDDVTNYHQPITSNYIDAEHERRPPVGSSSE